MKVTRRDFLKYACASAAVLGLSNLELNQLETVLAGVDSPPVAWLCGSCCSGCSVSLLNAVNPTIDDVLLNTISLKYHPTLMAAAGDLAVQAARSIQAAGGYILVVEGAIPTGDDGKYCYVWDEGGQPVTMADATRSLAAKASRIVAVGTCAAFGGIPSKYSAASALGVGAFLGRSVVNLPGCPAHPDWIIGSLVQLLSGQTPLLDRYNRPRTYYTSQSIHERCPREDWDEGGEKEDAVSDVPTVANSSVTFGIAGACLEDLGCKGKHTHADCDIRKWNNAQSYCIGVNGLCIGCTEPGFPAFPLHASIGVDAPPPVLGPYKTNLPFIMKSS